MVPVLTNDEVASKNTIPEGERSQNCDIYLRANIPAKISREPRENKAKQLLERVHSDIYGLITPETPSKKRLFIAFVFV